MTPQGDEGHIVPHIESGKFAVSSVVQPLIFLGFFFGFFW